jgi:arsenate reductase (thioredoxin)
VSKVLYVCKNNVGRSQMAMEIHNSNRPGEAYSAGTHVTDTSGDTVGEWAEGSDVFIEAMREIDLDISDNPRTQLTPELAHKFGNVIIMTGFEDIPYIEEHNGFSYWPVPDPHHMSLEDVRKIRDQIKQSVSFFTEQVEVS